MKKQTPKVAQLSTTMKAPDDPTRVSVMEISDPRSGLIGSPVEQERTIRNPNSAQVGFGPNGVQQQ